MDRVRVPRSLHLAAPAWPTPAAPLVGVCFRVSLQEKVEMQRQRFRLEFEKYRGFLALEEQLQLRRLEEEERATLQRLRENKNRLGHQSRALRELAQELEERSQRPALELLEVSPRPSAAGSA